MKKSSSSANVAGHKKKKSSLADSSSSQLSDSGDKITKDKESSVDNVDVKRVQCASSIIRRNPLTMCFFIVACVDCF
jgi:hypothetical protein